MCCADILLLLLQFQYTFHTLVTICANSFKRYANGTRIQINFRNKKRYALSPSKQAKKESTSTRVKTNKKIHISNRITDIFWIVQGNKYDDVSTYFHFYLWMKRRNSRRKRAPIEYFFYIYCRSSIRLTTEPATKHKISSAKILARKAKSLQLRHY